MKTFKGFINKTIYKLQVNSEMKKKDLETYLDDLIDVIVNEVSESPLTITVSAARDEN